MKQDKLNISIREERPEDFRRVEEITKEAFKVSVNKVHFEREYELYFFWGSLP
ncbi:MAG: hypothetical protein Q4E84_01670 [Clostridia bacterium]|nr:hypothetical protein [Clostridia bacterium]